jgi:xylulokinase
VSESYVIASDLGSSSCKTLLLNRLCRVVAVAQQGYSTSYPRIGWVEQSPQDWYEAFCATVRTVLEQSGIASKQVAVVGIVGVTHNAVLLDKENHYLRPAILLFDNRSTDQVRGILSRWGDTVRQRTLNEVTPAWSWPQLRWIRDHQPEVWRATRSILFQKDYVRHRLAPAPVTDVIDAGGTLLFDPVAEDWIPGFCEDLGLTSAHLPRVTSPLEIVSAVNAQGATDTGLMEGTPVIVGTTDTAAEVLGSGANRPGSATVKLASVGRIAVVTLDPLSSPHILNYHHVFDGLWYPGTAIKYAASAYRWLRDVMWPDLDDESTYQQMDEAAAQAPLGCGGLLFHPHLMGEWAPFWDERMRGDMIGLTVQHTRAHLTRAVLEGVAFALRDALTQMEDIGLKAEDIRLIGQGSRSKLWSCIIANVLNRPLRLPLQPDAAYGAALIAAIGVNLIDGTPEALERVIHIQKVIEPDPEIACLYDQLFDIYRATDLVLRSATSQLYEFEQRQGKQEKAWSL